MNYITHIFGLILFAGMVLSSTIGQIFVSQTKLAGYLSSEMQGSAVPKLTHNVIETSTLSDEKYEEDCICTPFHLCKTYEVAPDGHELIDIRINVAPCQSYLDVCCNDTKITSIENYKPSSPDTADSNCGCVEPEYYTKEPSSGHIDITKKPFESQKHDHNKKPCGNPVTEDYTKESYIGQKEDHTKESYVGQKEDHTKKPFDGHTEDYTKESYVGQKEDYTKESYVGQKEDHTKKPFDGYTEDYTKESYVGQKEDYTKESYVGQKEDHTKESYVGQKEDHTKKPFDGHTEDYTKESYVGQKEDYTKESYVGQKEDHTNESYIGQKEDHTKKPFDGHTEDYTKESYVGQKEDYTKESYVGQKEDYTKESYVGQKEDYTKESYVGQKEDHTKKPFDGHTEDYTKESYVGQKEDHTKDPHVGLTGYHKEPFVDHSYMDKTITSEQTVTTEVIKPDHDHQEKHKCGVWNKYGVGFRIGNAIDSESQFGEFPSMVAIFNEELSKDGEKKLVLHCGGSLIEKNVVLTAAHCVIKKDISTIVVRAGEWDLKTEKEVLSHQDRRVSKIITHPDYYSGGLYNDVALIFTESSFSLQENIQLICLPSTHDIFIDDMCFSSGWGKTVSYNNYTIVKKTESGKTKETGQYQVSILKKVELPIVPRSKCMDALRATRLGPKFILHDSFICAGGQEGKDTCKGDGGSPLMCPYKDDPEHLVQVGIVAWGVSCGLADIPAAYVNVAGFTYWITNEIEKYTY